MAEKKKKAIQELDWENYLMRMKRGFINRESERRCNHLKLK